MWLSDFFLGNRAIDRRHFKAANILRETHVFFFLGQTRLV